MLLDFFMEGQWELWHSKRTSHFPQFMQCNEMGLYFTLVVTETFHGWRDNHLALHYGNNYSSIESVQTLVSQRAMDPTNWLGEEYSTTFHRPVSTAGWSLACGPLPNIKICMPGNITYLA